MCVRACVWYVTTVAALGAPLSVWSPSWLGGYLWCQYTLAAPLYLPVEGPGPVDRAGWLRHRVPGVLLNGADPAHDDCFLSDMYSLVTMTSNTAQENKKHRSVGSGDVVRA